jgi:nucleotide-binding universal stress UspA family protein
MLDEAVVAAKEMLGDRLTRRMKTGDPARTILETADDAYDLIVMGTHGRVGRLHATLGSVAETVVRSAPCPVLTVRTPTGEEESFAERIHRAKSLAQQV